ncbi:MAG: hypothetical protein ABS939_16175 [Psychrobacillus sp.]|uniref:hypothetical protein n=1 Tax=Psychrobacillus sp. MER TA 171 TaxID=2939577 RepID=UPI002042217E|nr:hypothetical protein [Psychrobacillus sp. MER TA 171]MCM3359401.1 hypothetical protein [Psychrobacillus sp. MER TA 171]
MRKLTVVLMIFVLFLSACSNETDKKEGKSKDEKTKDEMVQVTIPFRFYDGVSEEQVLEQADKLGISKTTINKEDRLVEYEMTRGTQEEISADLKSNLKSFVEEIEANEDINSIKGIEYNKEYNDYTATVNRELYEADGNAQGYALLGLLLRTLYYHYFNGEDYETYEVKIDVKDEDTNKVFDTVDFPEDGGI